MVIYDNNKDITYMLKYMDCHREDWFMPYGYTLVIKEEHWDYFAKGNEKKILKIESDRPYFESGEYKYSCLPGEPGHVSIYKCFSWEKEDNEEIEENKKRAIEHLKEKENKRQENYDFGVGMFLFVLLVITIKFFSTTCI